MTRVVLTSRARAIASLPSGATVPSLFQSDVRHRRGRSASHFEPGSSNEAPWSRPDRTKVRRQRDSFRLSAHFPRQFAGESLLLLTTARFDTHDVVEALTERGPSGFAGTIAGASNRPAHDGGSCARRYGLHDQLAANARAVSAPSARLAAGGARWIQLSRRSAGACRRRARADSRRDLFGSYRNQGSGLRSRVLTRPIPLAP